MKRLLVTTAVEETWGQKQNILFLGDWCKLYKQRENWNKKVHDTVRYQGKDQNKFTIDHEYLVMLHEKIMCAVSKQLNKYHSTDYSLRHWRIIIGPWLSIFIPTIWERWENLKIAYLEHDFDEVFVTESSYCDFAKLDYKESVALLQKQDWNYQIYSDIILFQYKNACSIKLLKIKNQKNRLVSNKKKKSLIKRLQRFVDNMCSKIQKNYKVVFISSYFDIISLSKLSIMLRQFPRRYFQFDDDYFENKKEINERNITIEFNCKNDFESYLSKNLFKHIPYSYIEGFSILNKEVSKCNVNGKIIFSANAHFSNDFFKVWCAEQVRKNNSKLFISLHGGAIPSSMSAFARHEDLVSDKKIVWHKPLSKNQIRLPPNKFLRNKNVISENRKNVTIVGLDMGVYSYGHQSGPGSSLLLEDFNQKVVFIQKIKASLQKNIKVHPPTNPGWDIKNRYRDIFGEQIISPFESFSGAVYNSKIIVCTYPQTTFSEAMYSSIPTILLHTQEYWELCPEFDDLISTMMNAKIIFSDATLAAQHVSDVYFAPEIWWDSSEVVAARNLFYDYCLRTSDDWLSEWNSFFRCELVK